MSQRVSVSNERYISTDESRVNIDAETNGQVHFQKKWVFWLNENANKSTKNSHELPVESAFVSNEPNVESPLQPDSNIQPIDQPSTQQNAQTVHQNYAQMHAMFTKVKGGGMKKNSKQFSSAGFNMILIIDNATVFGDYYRVQNDFPLSLPLRLSIKFFLSFEPV